MISLKDLHDAVLDKIEFDWKEGSLSFSLKVGSPAAARVQIIADQVSHFNCPREYPWGESASINAIGSKQDTGATVLIIEMQSGDTLEIKCGAFSIK